MRHNTLKDSVYNLVKAEQIARVQTIYETEMRERENRELKIEKTLKEAQIESQHVLIIVVSIGLNYSRRSIDNTYPSKNEDPGKQQGSSGQEQ